MNTASRTQLRHIDRALLALLDERAHLLAETERDDPGRAPAVEDLLRRHAGPFPVAALREIFEVVERSCDGFHADRRAGS